MEEGCGIMPKKIEENEEEIAQEHGGEVESLKKTTDLVMYSTIVFGFIGVASLYLTIYLWDLTLEYKVLYWSILSLSLAFILLGVYSVLSDNVKAAERERHRRKTFEENIRSA